MVIQCANIQPERLSALTSSCYTERKKESYKAAADGGFESIQVQTLTALLVLIVHSMKSTFEYDINAAPPLGVWLTEELTWRITMELRITMLRKNCTCTSFDYRRV